MGADSKPDLSVKCKVLDGVLPLQDQQQGYGDTHTVYMVYNTQDKQVYHKHEFIARGTDIMTAERETEAMYEEVFPPPQKVNGVRQGRASHQQPPIKGISQYPTVSSRGSTV